MATHYATLISVDALKTHTGDGDLVIIDCRYSLTDADYGARCYAEGHIPGARFVDLDRQLSAPKRADSGRHPLPAKADFTRTIRNLGIHNDSQVVVYDDVSGGVCGRFWWMMRWAGHGHVAVLDGGIKAWVAADHDISTATPDVSASNFEAHYDDSLLATTDDVTAALTSQSQTVVDARAANRFRGEVEPIDPIAGHIPGSVNWPLTGNLNAEGRFLDPDALRAKLLAAGFGEHDRPSMHSCGSGVSACHNLLAWEVAGFGPGQLYVGSWSEWITDPARGVSVGDDNV